MPRKKLFVLANSIKKQNRCVAGREIVKYRDGKEYYGEWIRPVTCHDEGAVTITESQLDNGTIPAPFDVISVPVTNNENSPTQPENWYIQENVQWSKVTAWSRDEAIELIERPENLWLQPWVRQDRVTPEYLLSQKEHQSLYLIQPLNFHFSTDVTSWEGRERTRIRGVFTYNGQDYNFSMTDPLARQKYFPNFPEVSSEEVKPERSDDVIICVSLTPELKGYHYKIVATVIES